MTMPKPEWLVEQEKRKPAKEYLTCATCVYFGKPIRETTYKGKERCVIHECSLHPGCFNTKFSIICDDYQEDNLI